MCEVTPRVVAVFVLLAMMPLVALAGGDSDSFGCRYFGWLVQPIGWCEVESIVVETPATAVALPEPEIVRETIVYEYSTTTQPVYQDITNEYVTIQQSGVGEAALNQRIAEVLLYIDSLPHGISAARGTHELVALKVDNQDPIESVTKLASGSDGMFEYVTKEYVVRSLDRVYDRIADINTSGGSGGGGSSFDQDDISQLTGVEIAGTTYVSGSLGIGTSSPSDLLAIAGAIYIGNSTPANTDNRLYSTGGALYWDGSPLGVGGAADDLSDNSIADLSDVNTAGVGVSNLLSYNGSQWVVVSSSTFLMESEADSESELESILSDVSDVFTNNDLIADANISDALTISSAGTINPQAITLAAGNVLVGDGSNNAFATSSVYVDVNGSVGIGTSSPVSELAVDGDLTLTGGFYDNNFSRGTDGMVLQTTGSGIEWVATSTLGISQDFSGYFALADWYGTTTDGLAEGGSNLYYTDNRVAEYLVGSSSIWRSPTEAGLEAFLGGDVSDVFTDNDVIGVSNGGTGVSLLTPGTLLVADTSSSFAQLATSSLGINSDDIVAGSSNLFSQWTINGGRISYTGGLVGIGTTSPVSELAVDGDFTLTGGFYDNNFSRGTDGMVLQTTGSGIEWVATSTLGFRGLGNVVLNGSYLSGDGDDEGVFVNSDGDVGIGTNDPGDKLHISSGNLLLDNAQSIRWRNDFGTPNTIMAYNSSNALEIGSGIGSALELYGNNSVLFHVSGEEIARFSSAGNFGLYDQSADYRFEIASTTAAGYFGITDVIDGDVFVIDASGNVGIGTTSPPNKLSIDVTTNDGARVSGTVSDSIYYFVNNLSSNSSAYSEFIAQNDSGSLISTGIGSSNTLAEVFGNRGYTYSNTALSLIADNASGDIRFFTGGATASDESMRIEESGEVGIGTTTPVTKLTVVGVVTPGANNTYSLGNATYRWSEVFASNGTINTSDRRLKTDINTLEYGLDEVLAFAPVTYVWKDNPEQGTRLGLVAQDVELILPEVVYTGDDPDQTKGIRYTELIAVLISAVQEVWSEVSGNTERIEALEARIAELEGSASVSDTVADDTVSDEPELEPEVAEEPDENPASDQELVVGIDEEDATEPVESVGVGGDEPVAEDSSETPTETEGGTTESDSSIEPVEAAGGDSEVSESGTESPEASELGDSNTAETTESGSVVEETVVPADSEPVEPVVETESETNLSETVVE